jgi:hypothetical protein
VELSEYNGWENKFTWLMHLHLSNEQELMQEITALVSSTSRNRAAAGLLKTWVTTSLFNWLCTHPARDTSIDANVRLLAWDLAGSALAYTEWDTLVGLLTGRTKKSKNLFVMTFYQYILADGQLLALVQDMVQAFPRSYECADMMHDWFREQVDMLFDEHHMLPQPVGMASLVHELLQDTYKVIVWEHVARAFRPEY